MVFALVEDRSTLAEVYNVRIYFCSVVAATAAMVCSFEGKHLS